MIGTTNAVGSNVTADMLGIVIKGNSTPVGVDTVGQYVIVKNSTISDRPDGLYTAAKIIPANTAIDSTYLTAVSEGGLNALEGTVKKLVNVTINTLKICTSLTINAGAIVYDQQYSVPSVAGYRPIGILGYNSFGNNYANVSFSRMYYNSGTGKIEWAARNNGTASASVTVNVYLLYITII